MDLIFVNLLNRSIAAGWLILAVIVLRLLLRNAPKRLCCVLWGIVALRLICPFSLESAFSLIPSAEVISPAAVRYADKPVIDSGVSLIDSALNPAAGLLAPEPGASVNPLAVRMELAGILWGIGLVCMLLYATVSFGRLKKRVREAVPSGDNIWICDAVESPFILGIVRPRIYLPSSLAAGQTEYVLAHEYAHIKRKDPWWKLLGYLLLCVYWFHPLVWAAYFLLCRDIELACDEKVVRKMGLAEKKAYSTALVDLSAAKSGMSVCPLAFGEVGVKERVRAVLRYKKPAFWVTAAAALAVIAVAVCFLTNPKRDTFEIRIVIPAGCEMQICYSDTEVSPLRNRITLSSGEGLGDTEAVLVLAESLDGTPYASSYMTPGMPVKLKAEKGAWFRVGITASNPSDEDISVYVRVKGVTVRIASSAAEEDSFLHFRF
ncbi:MAG: M56 family metallopeptidase [bacterium]|nr:M56 family metallopeptidase [bacterium]